MSLDVSNNCSCSPVKTIAGSTGLIGTGLAGYSICILASAGVSVFPVIGAVMGVALVAFSLLTAYRALKKEHELERKTIPRGLEQRPVPPAPLALPPPEKKVEEPQPQLKRDPRWERIHNELRRAVQDRVEEKMREEFMCKVRERQQRREIKVAVEAKKALHAELLSFKFPEKQQLCQWEYIGSIAMSLFALTVIGLSA